MKEIWKDIEGYEGKYQISNLGKVRILKELVLQTKLIEYENKLKDKDNLTYLIYKYRFKDKITGKENYVGRSHYDDRTIYVEKNTPKQTLLTLKHELMHVWLYENGHTNQNGTEVFDYEDVCELVALSNNSINKVVDEYILKKVLLKF